MPRQRTELPPDVNAAIAARTARGESAETIFQAIGKVISVPTISRRQRELRGRTGPDRIDATEGNRRPSADGRAAPASAPEEPAPTVPDEIPDATPLEDLTRWIAIVDRGMTKAELDGNLAALASLAQKGAALAALRHKSAPLPKADPNENPDYKALAAQGRERLRKLAHGLFA